MPKATRRYSAKLKFQVVLEALRGEKTPAQIAKAYAVHANSVGIWKQQFLELGAHVNLVASLDRTRALEVLYTDFTEPAYTTGKAHLMTPLDHTSKVVVGSALGPRADAEGSDEGPAFSDEAALITKAGGQTVQETGCTPVRP